MNEQAPFSPHRNFADNLRALCTRHGSIAAVCRELGMNRQQFNKYLAGSTLPNAATLERICSFFRIESESLFHDPAGFRSPAPQGHADAAGLLRSLPPAALGAVAGALGRMQQASLRTGCYHFYSAWPRDASKCVRAALLVHRKDDTTLFTRFTKFRPVGQRQRHYLSGRHDGIVLESDTARFLLSLNRKGFGEVSLVTIGAENALAQDFLSGLALVMAPSGMPQAQRVTLEYRGCASALRRTLAEAGVLPMSDPSVPEDVRQSLTLPPEQPVAHLEPYSLLDSLPAAFRS